MINVCIPKYLDDPIGAALRSATHNPDNLPIPAALHQLPDFHPLELAGESKKFWKPGTTLTIAFMGGTPTLQARVLKAMRRWSDVCNINFQPTDSVNGIKNAICRVAFNKGQGSWSYIGTDNLSIPRDEETMNFGWFDDTTTDTEINRTVLHETGHLLGFDHEFELALALGSLKINEAAVIAYFAGPPNFWNEQQTRRQILQPLNLGSVVHSDFDRRSIMEYTLNPSWFIPPTQVLGNTDLSPVDIAKAQEWYPFPRELPASPSLFQIWEAHIRFEAQTLPFRISPEAFAPSLAVVASSRAHHLAEIDQMVHDDQLSRQSIVSGSARAWLSVLGYPITAENLFSSPTNTTIKQIIEKWSSDSAHKANMTSYSHAGYGWAYSPTGTLYVVGLFGGH